MTQPIAHAQSAFSAHPPGGDPERRRWAALVFIALAQLMVALDATIVSVALPTVQRTFHSSDPARQWVITAYTLAFAGLLLLGGRIADAIGRKRALSIGLVGFAAASALGGLAPSFGVLILARALQGAFAALLSPTALSLVAVTFTEARERAKAFAVYGAVAGSGGALGLVLSGALTQSVGWRWCLFVNLLFAAIALVGARRLLPEAPKGPAVRLDVPGALLAIATPTAVVYGCAEALAHGWGAPSVLGALGVGLVGLAAFVAQEKRSPAPLLPLPLIADRNRGGACLAAALAIVGMFGLFLLLNYYFQVVRHLSPVQAGLAFLPMSAAGLLGSSVVSARLLPKVGARGVMVSGLLIAAAGMALVARIGLDSGYWLEIAPAEVAAGFGISCVMIAAFNVATHGVSPREAGAASAAVNMAQQVGASIGTALLNTVAAGASAAFLAAGRSAELPAALVHGYSVAAASGAGVLLAAAAFSGLLVTARRPASRSVSPASPS